MQSSMPVGIMVQLMCSPVRLLELFVSKLRENFHSGWCIKHLCSLHNEVCMGAFVCVYVRVLVCERVCTRFVSGYVYMNALCYCSRDSTVLRECTPLYFISIFTSVHCARSTCSVERES